MRIINMIAISAAIENHATLLWPRCVTMTAANRGPVAVPALPPT